jgi:hypothetical protein
VKRILVTLSLVFVLACNTPAPTPTPIPADTHVSPDITITPTPKPSGFTNVRISPSDGTLKDQLAAEAQKAGALGRMPVVEFDATW